MPLQLLLSRTAAERFGARIATILQGDDFQLIHVEDLDAECAIDVALITRDVTGNSTKHQLAASMERFCSALGSAQGLS